MESIKQRKPWFEDTSVRGRVTTEIAAGGDTSGLQNVMSLAGNTQIRVHQKKKTAKQAKKKYVESNVESLDLSHKLEDIRRFFAEVGFFKQGYSHGPGMVRCGDRGLATSPKF